VRLNGEIGMIIFRILYYYMKIDMNLVYCAKVCDILECLNSTVNVDALI
jgi:hypothetical protein